MTDKISRNQAARLLKKSPRTVGRMVERGELTVDKDGFFDREEVEELSEIAEEESENSASNVAITELREGHATAMQFAERMMKLLEEPIRHALDTVTTVNTQLVSALKDSESAKQEFLKVVGEVLLQKEERETERAVRAERLAALRKGGELLEKYGPKLLEQMGGKGAKPFKDLLDSLTKEERDGIFGLYHFLDSDEKKAKFKAVADLVGAEIPPDESAPSVSESGESGESAS
jgi:hypothetical protein